MSSAEEYFGSSPDPIELQLGSLYDDAPTSFEELLELEAAEVAGAFAQVRRQFDHLKANYATVSGTDWQSFHRLVGHRTSNIWIANRLDVKQKESFHVLICREHDDADRNILHFTEYAIANDEDHWAMNESEATKTNDVDTWSRELLGDSALIQLQNGDKVALFRGAGQPTLLAPWNYQKIVTSNEALFDANAFTRRELGKLQDLLAELGTGSYYEPGATGNLY